ncbi:MAG: hypothetical protein DMF69_17365 [Acidobacteria bacterium]|nr:MAG: hypothetical protein DMF69_17365 [Acidobacteriota bacterium]
MVPSAQAQFGCGLETVTAVERSGEKTRTHHEKSNLPAKVFSLSIDHQIGIYLVGIPLVKIYDAAVNRSHQLYGNFATWISLSRT